MQSWNPASARPPRPRNSAFNAADFEALRSGAYNGRCLDVYIWQGKLQHKKLQAVNDAPFEELAAQMSQQAWMLKHGSQV